MSSSFFVDNTGSTGDATVRGSLTIVEPTAGDQKTLRVSTSNNLEIVNSAEDTVISSLTDTGVLTLSSGLFSTVINTNSTNPLTGTYAADQSLNGLTVQVDRLNVGTNTVRGFNVYHNFGGSAAFGYRIGTQCTLQQTSPTAFTNTARGYTALEALVISDVGDGGSGLGNTAGSYWAFNPFTQLGAGAVFTTEASGIELNLNLLTGSNTLDKYGYKVVQFGTDAVQGSRNDAAYFAGNIAGAVGWKAIFQIGDTVNQNPLSASGSVLLLKGSPTFDKGIDFTGATITTAAFKSPGFIVDGSGNTTANALTLTTVAKLLPLTFATLPGFPAVGQIAYISDCNTVTWGATAAGSSTNKVLVWYNGSNWTVFGK